MMDDIARRSGITGFTLLVNSIGCPACRPAFIADLKKYYAGRADSLCKDCGGRLDRNPLRLLDCKQESCKSLKKDAPRITDFLCEGCRAHHAAVKGYLSGAHIAYTEDHLLVRGLD